MDGKLIENVTCKLQKKRIHNNYVYVSYYQNSNFKRETLLLFDIVQ